MFRQNSRYRDRERSRGEGDGDNDSQSGRRPGPPGGRDGGGGGFSNAGTRFPDSQQLFVGNLPHNIQEKELVDFFTGKCY